MRPEALEVLKGSDLILHAANLPDVRDLDFFGHAFSTNGSV